jgi:hypothetical protein
MAPCRLCNDQELKDEHDRRLAFAFTPQDISHSAFEMGCESCIVILEGIRQSETDWAFSNDVKQAYAICRERRGVHTDSLNVELYFYNERPKLELEFYSRQPFGEQAIFSTCSIIYTVGKSSLQRLRHHSLACHFASTINSWPPIVISDIKLGSRMRHQMCRGTYLRNL